MKSYNHLYEKYISDENIIAAIQSAAIGKRDRKEVQYYCVDPISKVDEVRTFASAENFQNEKHKPIEIYDGISRKKRTIIVPTFKEQIVHHMVVNILKPIFMKGMYYHSNGSIPGRGAHKGKKDIEKFIRRNGKDTKYCFKYDIKKYFESIPHDILIEKLRRIIHDERFMAILEEIIKATPNGLPLGFYTSQWLANWYLQGLDHYIKEELHAKAYFRYMDDGVIFDRNKKNLHKMKKAIEKYMKGLGLTLKENWQIFRFSYNGKFRFLDFMGFRFYNGRTTLRSKIFLKMCRKAKKIAKKDKATIHDCRAMLSYLGWIDCTDTYRAYEKHIKPYVDFGKMKKRISKYDRRMTRERRIKNVA